MDVEGRTAIVTGASRGIGKHVAVALGGRGANVVVAARTVEPHKRLSGTIGETVEAVESAGGRALAVRADVSDPADVAALVEQAIERFGGIDVLINNAADTSGGTTSVLDLGRDEWLRQFDVNLHGPFALIQAAVPAMRERGGGVIVNMTSSAGDLTPVPAAGGGSGPSGLGEKVGYAATKAAVNRLTNVIAAELRELGIAVVAVDPGFTRTELVDLMGERGLVDPAAAVPMDVPMKTIMHVITGDDPMRYTGQVLRAAAFVAEHGL